MFTDVRLANGEVLGGTVPAAAGLIIAGFADERAPIGVELVVAAR